MNEGVGTASSLSPSGIHGLFSGQKSIGAGMVISARRDLDTADWCLDHRARRRMLRISEAASPNSEAQACIRVQDLCNPTTQKLLNKPRTIEATRPVMGIDIKNISVSMYLCIHRGFESVSLNRS